jgi:hypothetical protein
MAAAELCRMPLYEYRPKHGSPSPFRKETLLEKVEPGAIENLILSLNSEGFTLKELSINEANPNSEDKKKSRRRQGKKR